MAAPLIRRMEQADLDSALRLTQAIGWSHRLLDWEFHFRLGRGFVAIDAAGELVGTSMWWAYGRDFGCVGLIVVDVRRHGKGIGGQLMKALLEETGPRGLQLVATDAGLKLYRRCGFKDLGGFEQRQGVLRTDARVASPAGFQLRAASPADLPELVKLDAVAFGANRKELIAAVLAAGRGVIAGADGGRTGYALARPSGRGTLIGPVVAESQPLAAALIAGLLEEESGFARVDVPEKATGLAGWLDAAGLVCVDRVLAMQRGTRPGPPGPVQTFGLASQAFG